MSIGPEIPLQIAIGVFSLIFCLGLMYIGVISLDPADEDDTQTEETILQGFGSFESETSTGLRFSMGESAGSNRTDTRGQGAREMNVRGMAASPPVQGSSVTSTVPCPDCGETNPVTKRFCDVCGSQLRGSDVPGEYGSGLLPISRRRNTPSGLEDEDVFTNEGEEEEISSTKRADEDLL